MTLSLWLIALHFLGDFLLQSDWMALNKSKRWDALLVHVSLYSACFAFYGWQFVGITFVLHFLTDAITSRITSRLWFLELTPIVNAPVLWPSLSGQEVFRATVKEGYRHWFFVMIGFDQVLHYTALSWTPTLASWLF